MNLTIPGQEIIQTERMHLKIVTPDLIPQILEQYTEEAFMRYFGHVTIDESALLRKKLTVGLTNYNISFRLFVLTDKITAESMGACNFHVWQIHHRRAEIGYLINEQYRGKGLMKEAMEAVIHHGFAHMGLNRIEAFIGHHNEASQRLVHHFGFTREGVMREHYCRDNMPEDSICFSLLKREYDTIKKDNHSTAAIAS